MGESTSALYLRDPEQATLMRRQQLAQQLAAGASQTPMRTAAGPWSAIAQALSGAVAGVVNDGRMEALGEERRTGAAEFMARALGGQTPPATPAPALPPGGPAQPPPMPGPVAQTPLAPARASAQPPPELMPHFEAASRATGVPLQLLIAQAAQESGFRPDARGAAGEIGVMQVRPTTAQQPGYGVQPIDPATLSDPAANIMFGAQYLAGRGRANGATDLSDPAQRAVALRQYNGTGQGGDPNYVTNVSGRLPDGAAPAAPAAAPQAPAAPPQQSERQRIARIALEGMQSTNPAIRERATQLMQYAQTLPQNDGGAVTTAAPGSALIRNGQVIGNIPAAPDRPGETERLIPRWRELSELGANATPQQVAERDMLSRRIGGAGNNVNIDQRGQSTFEQERGKTLAAEEQALRLGGTNARQTLARLGEVERNLGRFTTGVTSETRIRAGQIATGLGIPLPVLERLGIDPNAVASGEQIRSQASAMLQGMLGPGGFPSANFSNADREMLERALPSLANSPNGNRLIIQTMRLMAERQAEVSGAWNDWRRVNGSGMESFERFNMERMPQLTNRDVLAPLLQDAFPASDASVPSATVPGPNGGAATPPPALPPPPPGFRVVR